MSLKYKDYVGKICAYEAQNIQFATPSQTFYIIKFEKDNFCSTEKNDYCMSYINIETFTWGEWWVDIKFINEFFKILG